LFVCAAVAVIITLTTAQQKSFVERIKQSGNQKNIMIGVTLFSILLFLVVSFAKPLFGVETTDTPLIMLMLFITLLMTYLISLSVTYYVKYDQYNNTEGLTVWSI